MQTILSVVRLRQILLRLSAGLSDRAIAQDLKIGRRQLRVMRKILNSISTDYEVIMTMDDAKLLATVQKAHYETPEHLAEKERKENLRKSEIVERVDYYRQELQRPGVTLQVLWQEYAKGNESPYGYSFFCRIVNLHLKKKQPVYHRFYSPGDILLIDFAGDKMYYMDRETGERHEPATLVCVMAYSNYTYVEMLPNASTDELVRGLNNCLNYLEGIPHIALSDNMAQWAIKPHRYEPIFSHTIEQWANHNGIQLQAARVAHPKDKSPVENQVRIIYSRIYAPLRDRRFFSLEELNEAVLEQLDKHNKINFQSRTYSRHDQFTTDEKPLLAPLPPSMFVPRHYTQGKVQGNCHVYMGEDKHYYSVPFALMGERVEIIYDTLTVEIFYKVNRVATHMRHYKEQGYTTNISHLSPSLQATDNQLNEGSEQLLQRAAGYGEFTRQYVDNMLKSRPHPTHAFKAIQGILRLGALDKYGPLRLENACKLGLSLKEYRYRIIEAILKNKQDLLQSNKPPNDQQTDKSQDHENLRGKDNFKDDLS